MSRRLGTPYMRGKSDVIENFAPNGGNAVAEGLAVILHTDGTIKPFAGSGVIIGVAGVKEMKNQSVVRNGLEVVVQIASGAVPAKGAAVYVDADGKFTQAATTGEGGSAVNNTAVNATFRGAKETAVTSAGTSVDAAAIDFAGGL